MPPTVTKLYMVICISYVCRHLPTIAALIPTHVPFVLPSHTNLVRNYPRHTFRNLELNSVSSQSVVRTFLGQRSLPYQWLPMSTCPKERRSSPSYSWNAPLFSQDCENLSNEPVIDPPPVIEPPPPIPTPDPCIQYTSRFLRRTSWLSWWGQVLLTSVSAVILVFAKSAVEGGGSRNRGVRGFGGFFLPGSGITLSMMSIFWTWGMSGLSRRLLIKHNTPIQTASMLRRVINIGSTLNMCGMCVTLAGSETIMGHLVARVLTMQGVFSTGGGNAAALSTQTLQPLDILVILANTNTMLSHYLSLAFTLHLIRPLHLLDPPSLEIGTKRSVVVSR